MHSSTRPAKKPGDDQAETTVTVKTDGTGKTAHQVFDAPGGGSVTCEGVSGHGVMKGSTAASLSVTFNFEQTCTVFGQPGDVHAKNCVLVIKPDGEMQLGGAGCELTVTTPGCEIRLTTPATYKGLTFHDITSAGTTLSTPGTATYVTVSAAVNGIKGEEVGPLCPAPGAFTTGEFTTGNATVEGENVGGSTMTSVWWA